MLRICRYVFLILSLVLIKVNVFSVDKEAGSGFAEHMLKEADRLTGIGNYPEAYDNAWEVLSIADSIHNTTLKYKAYRKLAMLYSIFYDSVNAFASIDSMFLYANKSGGSIDLGTLGNLYYTAAITYRMNSRYDKAQQYLNTCENIMDSVHSTIKGKRYFLTEKAHLNTLTGNYKESEQILRKISGKAQLRDNYSSIVYSMWGDLYMAQGNDKKAIEYFNKSLEVIAQKNDRIGMKVDLLKKSAELNEKLGNYKIALEQMSESKLLGDSLFGSQNASNKQLFEIKDSYRKAILENQRIRREQELKLLKSEKQKLNQQLTFSLVLFAIVAMTSIVVIRLIRRRHAAEKELVAERIKAELEIKKKELAVTALQLIEKDKLLDEIKQGLKKVQENKDDASVQQIESTININSAKTWEDFEARFVQVNSSFYESLGEKHSNLSRNELKLCALIKLNFSSKEMAQLLGVSPESVNKARYRLRKKLDLQRDDNLVSYINSI